MHNFYSIVISINYALAYIYGSVLFIPITLFYVTFSVTFFM